MSQDKKSLLVIEDDPGLQKQLRWSFDAYEVLVASDRESALALLRRHEPAVVTMDLGLPPDPDGASEGLATLVQILELAPDTKVIVLTGNQDHGNALKAVAAGRIEVLRLHRIGDIDEQVLQELERDLDLEEMSALAAKA